MTNEITQYVQVLDDVGYSITQLKEPSATIILCIIIGYVLKLLPWIKNKYIPCILILVVGPLICISFMDVGVDAYINIKNLLIPKIRNGMLFGFVGWLIHNKFLAGSWIEKALFPPKEDKTTTIPDNANG